MRLITALFTALLALTPLVAPAAEAPARESAYDRVMRTGTLRCGYIIIPPQLDRDINSGAMRGLMADVMADLGQRLNLKIEWAEEVGFPAMAAGLDTQRYDAVCFSLYRLAAGARALSYTAPLFYSKTSIYVRADDHRFDGSLTALNDPAVKIATIDGEMAAILARTEFPKAATYAMPQMTDLSQMLLSVASGKADVALLNDVVASGYLKANPGQLRALSLPIPLRVFSHGLAFGIHEHELGSMLNAAIEEMRDNGMLDQLLSRHELLPGTYLRVARPYEVPTGE